MILRRLRILMILSIISVICLFLLFIPHNRHYANSSSLFYQSSRNADEFLSGIERKEIIRSEVKAQEREREEFKNKLMTPVPVPAPQLMHNRNIQLALDEIQKYATDHINRNLYNKPKTIFIVTTWRSGSTFFGEAISSHPAAYYHYEPLTGFEELDTDKWLSDALYTIENLSRCDYSHLDNYMSLVKNDTSILAHNDKLKRACNFLANDCFNKDFLMSACNKFPIQIFKFVRIHAEALEHFLETPDVHLVYLVRDPRSIFASRTKLPWCMQNARCGDSKSLCNFVNTNLEKVKNLISVYPGQVQVVRYEDLATNPLMTLKKLFGDIKIDWDPGVEKYLDEHTRGDKDDPWSTYRIPKLRIYLWMKNLKSDVVKKIQNECDGFMNKLNYSKIDTTLCGEYC